MRIRDGDNPLDLSGVHPETYPVVERLLGQLGKPLQEVMGRSDVLRRVRPNPWPMSGLASITVKDVLAELEKPGRDPRPTSRWHASTRAWKT